ncbi:MAG: ABC transporter permease [Castellaniella sp.]|uniref:ABC transporter permease n=1 Tax=Castellaniella hirudinis TaxID=1144617 RepID=A0ABV8S1F7_9BURK
MILDPEFFLSALRVATPLIIVALGVLVAELVGILFLCVEGVMLCGALFGMLGASYFGDPWIGVACGLAAGITAGLICAGLFVWVPADQVVIGLAFNIAALGLTSFIFRATTGVIKNSSASLAWATPDWAVDHPFLSFLFQVPPLAWLAAGLFLIAAYLLFRSAPGLMLRSVGQSVEAATSAGLDVLWVRTVAMGIAGGLAGLGGAALTVGWVHSFSDNITAGRGFIALAVVYFGRWYPGWTFFGGLLFGAGEVLGLNAQVLGGNSHLYLMVPYVLTIIVLGMTGGGRGPREVARPYERD